MTKVQPLEIYIEIFIISVNSVYIREPFFKVAERALNHSLFSKLRKFPQTAWYHQKSIYLLLTNKPSTFNNCYMCFPKNIFIYSSTEPSAVLLNSLKDSDFWWFFFLLLCFLLYYQAAITTAPHSHIGINMHSLKTFITA